MALKKQVKKKYEKRKARNFILRNGVLQFRTQRARYFPSLIQTTLFNTFIRNRNLWAYERDETWFSKLMNNDDGDPNFDIRWRNEFRMKHSTFLQIVQLVRPRLEKRDTQLRKAIPIKKRVVALWKLSTGNSFRSIEKTFGIGKCTAVQITAELCKEISFISFIHQVPFKQKGHSRCYCEIQTGLPIKIATSCTHYRSHAHPDTNRECRGIKLITSVERKSIQLDYQALSGLIFCSLMWLLDFHAAVMIQEI